MGNPLAVAMFAIYASLVSGMEVVLFVVADRAKLFPAPLTPAFRRFMVLGSLSPIPIFLITVPVALWSPALTVVIWFLGSLAIQVPLNVFLRADPPPDPSPAAGG